MCALEESPDHISSLPAISSQRNSCPDVVFVSMPYASIERPSVALGTLAGCLERASISTRTLYGNLLFAERIGIPDYEGINNSDITSQIGEWTFSEIAFRREVREVNEYIEGLHQEGHSPISLKQTLLRIRSAAAAFIEEFAAQVVAHKPRIVGCSSVFQQHCASLALLRKVRELDPSIITMIGGANCESSMGQVTHTQYSWVDYVVSGEADKLLPELCQLIFQYGQDVPVEELPFGVLGPKLRQQSQKIFPIYGETKNASEEKVPRALVSNLDEIPVPNYDDYFAQLEQSPLRESIVPCIALETSRGCWWGAKHHCTFCGLNGVGLSYRAKSEDRVEDEIRWLSHRYGLKKFMTVDNILDVRYFGKVLPAIEKMGDMRFFYETKANLNRSQVAMLSSAGVRWIQPGIEALHDDLLALLNKGCTTSTNVQLLKWAYNYGIWVIWNHLYGAPGDNPDWYEKIADWLPLIIHLQPPTTGGITRVRFDRFSPYFHNIEAYGLKLTPYWAYSHVYPLDQRQLMDQAYFFCNDGPQSPSPTRLINRMQEWSASFYGQRASVSALPKRSENAPVLQMQEAEGRVFIRDTRPCSVASFHELSPLQSAICRATDAARSRKGIEDTVRGNGFGVSEEELYSSLQELVERKIVVDFDGKYLCLATEKGAIPYLGFEEFAGGLALLSGRKRKEEPPMEVDDPWDMPLSAIF